MACTKDADCPQFALTNVTLVNQTCAYVNIKSYPAAPHEDELSFIKAFNNSALAKTGDSGSACMLQ